jgi:hypothetical protein
VNLKIIYLMDLELRNEVQECSMKVIFSKEKNPVKIQYVKFRGGKNDSQINFLIKYENLANRKKIRIL